MRLALLTSGGDAPGMNAAIRAVVRCGVSQGFEVVGVRNGYKGLVQGELFPMGRRDVGGIIQLGGTKLGTSRYEPMKASREGALRSLRRHEISALIVIGGNGSQSGAHALHAQGAPVIGVASTIDNDLCGTDVSIGATTAVDVALEAMDRLRVTASAMRRAFLVEVMGRHCGHLALMAGIAGGAEVIALPEQNLAPEQIAQELSAAYDRGKSHAIGVISEGARYDADALMSYFDAHHERLGFELRVTRLGHIQRGGAPGAFDRMLGTLLGAAAVDSALAGRHGTLIGWRDGKPASTPLAEVAGRTRPADLGLLKLAGMLAL
ncbi:MAG TPA: ATP-dependent 6-phosphofructokinase [Steroidobacteraceae bacterium]|nr:ATP-dependent 6-phosphofructokinase [Steroidobacteraceae bacterium]